MCIYSIAATPVKQGENLTQVRDACAFTNLYPWMMRKLLVFQHSAREPLGVLDPMLRKRVSVRYVNFSRHPAVQPDVSRYNGLIVLGGP